VGYIRYLSRCTAIAIVLAGIASSQVAILQIQVVEGEGAVHVPGARTNRSVTVAVTDETGKPVAGAAVSFHLPEDGPGGTFVNGLRTDIAMTDARGQASVRAFQANRLPGRFQLRIVASKEQARAGTVSFQYIGETVGGGAAAAPRTAAATSGGAAHSNRKWYAIAAAVAGGAVVGALASRGSSTSTAVTPPVTLPPPLTIGVPSISVGKP
jgi:hypothetical protein